VVAADIDAHVELRIGNGEWGEARIQARVGRRGQELGRAVLGGLGAYALGDECGGNEILRGGNELAAILLLPGGSSPQPARRVLEVDGETLADGLIDVTRWPLQVG